METTMDDLVQIAGMAGTIPDYKAREILSAVLPAIARKMEEATPESAAKLAAMMFDDLGSLSMRKAKMHNTHLFMTRAFFRRHLGIDMDVEPAPGSDLR